MQPEVETIEQKKSHRVNVAAENVVPLSDPIFARLEEQIDWYDRKSRAAQRMFKRIKVTEIVSAAVIPFLAGVTFPGPLQSFDKPTIAALGVLITILEGFLHLNQYQQLWGTYRSTCEALKHEKFIYLAKAGPYTIADPYPLLAERVESLVSQEHAQWNSFQQQAGKSDAKSQ